jgi:hypothetical protein
MGGRDDRGFPPRSLPCRATTPGTSEAHQKWGCNLVQVSKLHPHFWRATWHLREAAPTMGEERQRGKQYYSQSKSTALVILKRPVPCSYYLVLDPLVPISRHRRVL